MAGAPGFEPGTWGIRIPRSVQLSYAPVEGWASAFGVRQGVISTKPDAPASISVEAAKATVSSSEAAQTRITHCFDSILETLSPASLCGLLCNFTSLFGRQLSRARLPTGSSEVGRRFVFAVVYAIGNLPSGDVHDELAELYRITRSFQSFFAHGREYGRAPNSAQVADSSR